MLPIPDTFFNIREALFQQAFPFERFYIFPVLLLVRVRLIQFIKERLLNTNDYPYINHH